LIWLIPIPITNAVTSAVITPGKDDYLLLKK
ncbi:MAG: hypothetical protein A8274_1117, partial [Halanaerobium sp. 4-GBenrich]